MWRKSTIIAMAVLAIALAAGFYGCGEQENPVGSVNQEKQDLANFPDSSMKGGNGEIDCIGACIVIAWPFNESMWLWTGWQGERTSGGQIDPQCTVNCKYTHSGAEWYARDLNRPGTADFGKNVYAGMSGQVVQAYGSCPSSHNNCHHNRGYGNNVVIYDWVHHVAIRYSHLSQTFVTVGQWVTAAGQPMCGSLIGKVGNTGHSEGSHLHLAAYENIDHFQSNGYPIIPTPNDSQWYTCMTSFYCWQ